MKSLFAFIHMLFWAAIFSLSKPEGEPVKLTPYQRWQNFVFLITCAAIIGGIVVVAGAFITGYGK